MKPVLNGLRYFSLCILLFAAGCSSSTGQRSVDDLKSAPKSLTLGGNIYTLGASVWRDLMPSIDTSVNKGIIVSLKLIGAAILPAGDSLNVVRIFIVNKNSLWQTKPQRQSLISPNQMELYVSGGPLWEPGSKVTAVLEFKFAGKTKLLSSGETEIRAVY